MSNTGFNAQQGHNIITVFILFYSCYKFRLFWKAAVHADVVREECTTVAKIWKKHI